MVNQSESSNNFFLPFAGALVFETGDTKSSSSPANKLFDFWGCWGLGYCLGVGIGACFIGCGFVETKGESSSSSKRLLLTFLACWGLVDDFWEGKSAPSSSSKRLFFLVGDFVGGTTFLALTISVSPSSSSNKPFFLGWTVFFGA